MMDNVSNTRIYVGNLEGFHATLLRRLEYFLPVLAGEGLISVFIYTKLEHMRAYKEHLSYQEELTHVLLEHGRNFTLRWESEYVKVLREKHGVEDIPERFADIMLLPHPILHLSQIDISDRIRR